MKTLFKYIYIPIVAITPIVTFALISNNNSTNKSVFDLKQPDVQNLNHSQIT